MGLGGTRPTRESCLNNFFFNKTFQYLGLKVAKFVAGCSGGGISKCEEIWAAAIDLAVFFFDVENNFG